MISHPPPQRKHAVAVTLVLKRLLTSTVMNTMRLIPKQQQRRRILILLVAYLSSRFYSKLFVERYRIFTPSANQIITSTLLASGGAREVYCLGFRRTTCDDTSQRRLPWLDIDCNTLIPPTVAGYCEFAHLNSTSYPETFQLYHKRSCQGVHKKAKTVNCNMVIDFHNYKYDANDYVANPPIQIGTLSSQSQSQQLQQQQPNQPAANKEEEKVDDAVGGGAAATSGGGSGSSSNRGIVMSIYPKQMLSVYSILRLLREYHHCTLPIELWFLATEMMENSKAATSTTTKDPLLEEILAKFDDITLRIIDNNNHQNQQIISGFMVKPYAIMYSNFTQILWIDSDNIPVRDPTYLFETAPFQTTGTLFWKDYWQPNDTVFFLNEFSLVWELLGISTTSNRLFFPTFAEEAKDGKVEDNRNSQHSPLRRQAHDLRNEFEMESGQLLIDKSLVPYRVLERILFLATTYESRWLGPLKLLWGDKDLFRMGFYMTMMTDSNNPSKEATIVPPSFVPYPPAPMGYSLSYSSSSSSTYQRMQIKTGNIGHSTCGITMVQYDMDRQPIFLHRNSFKLTANELSTQQPVMEAIYEFVGTNPSQEYRIGGTSRDKSRGKSVTCYHPTALSSEYFREYKNLTKIYPNIIQVENQFLSYAKDGLRRQILLESRLQQVKP